MAVSASLDLCFFSNDEISPICLVNTLLRNGWKLSVYGEKWYLPVGDVEEFDWQISDSISDKEIIGICNKKLEAKEIIGLFLTWMDTNVGGSFLFYPIKDMSISLDINRVEKIQYKTTDFDWYLCKIIPTFILEGLKLESVCFQHFS